MEGEREKEEAHPWEARASHIPTALSQGRGGLCGHQAGATPPGPPPRLTLAATASMLAGTMHSKVLGFFSRE